MASLLENFGRLFGIEILDKNEEENKKEIKSFTPEVKDDGAIAVVAGGVFGTYLDMEGTVRTESEIVTRYRQMSLYPEVYSAIEDIANEAIVMDDDFIVRINLDKLKVSENIKKRLEAEFEEVLLLLNFDYDAFEIFKRWYIDGRLYYHSITKEDSPSNGIIEMRYIDPRKIRKVREIKQETDKNGIVINKTVDEYYFYNDKGFPVGTGNTNFSLTNTTQNTGIKIAIDSIIQVTSGLMDENNNIVLSYLHKAIKVLNQVSTLEDATVIYRISRAPERLVFYVDTGNLPRQKAEQYVQQMMSQHKNKLVYDQSTGEIRDDRKFMCYALDTKIPLLDGRTLTIAEIIKEYNSGKLNWVYSCDPITGKFVPGPISWAGVTKKNSEVVKVTFDNGKNVICTPDHKFPVWNKGFIEAKDLSIGESLIPGYRRTKEITKNGCLYEQIFKNDTKTWEFTHREVAKWKIENNISEEYVYSNKYLNNKKSIIHHKNFNRYDNDPNNLVYMNHKDHMKYHQDIQKIEYTSEILLVIEECAKQLLSIKDTINFVNSEISLDNWKKLNVEKNIKNRNINELVFSYKDLMRIVKENGFKSWKEYRKTFDTAIREPNGRKKRGTCDKYSSEWKNKLSIAAKNRYSTQIEQFNNHKVVSVEFLTEKMDVAALTIDQEETYHSHHTYLLDAGVYTKNTMLENYWLPRREGGKGTEIQQMQGGQNLGELTDVNYFLKKLMAALGVPISRLEPDRGFSLGRTSEISRDEIKFSKFVNRLRRRFNQLFLKTLGRQAVLKGVCTKDEWKDFERHITFEYKEDNHFAELKDSEILQARIGLASEIQQFVGSYYSHEFVRKVILRQNDDDIDTMNSEIEDEKYNENYMKISNMGQDQGFGPDSYGMMDGNPPSPMDNANNFLPFEQDEENPANPQLKKIGDKAK